MSKISSKILCAGVLTLLTFTVIFTACEIGLGDIVNTERPIIAMPEDGNAPGSFMKGSQNCLELSVEQPFGIDNVYMTVWYIDKEAMTEKEKKLPAHQYPPAPPWCSDETHTHKEGMYYVDLNTEEMLDGQIRAQVTAVDLTGNKTTTTDIIYTVKNTLPQLEMTVPQVVKSSYENFNFMTENEKQIPLIYATNSLMGIATDLYGIEQGYPQIMIWPAEDNGGSKGIQLDPDYNEDGSDYPASNAREWGTWRTVLDDKEIAIGHDGAKAVMFRWTTKKLIEDTVNGVKIFRTRAHGDPLEYPYDYFEVGRYHFKVRVKDKFGTTNIYPYRSDSGLPDGTKHPNDYLSVYVALTTNPIIEFLERPEGSDQPYNRFYNATYDFERDFTINALNGVNPEKVQAMITTSLKVDFDNDPGYAAIELIDGGQNNGTYRVTIAPDEVKKITDSKSSDGVMLHVRAEDTQGQFSIASLAFILDLDKPNIEFFNPAALSDKTEMTKDDDSLTSSVRFMGTAIDTSTRVTKMYYRLGKTEVSAADDPDDPDFITGWTDTGRDNPLVDKIGHNPNTAGTSNNLSSNVKWAGTLSNWRWEFAGAGGINDLYQSANVTQAAGTGGNYYLEHGADLQSVTTNIWYLPIHFKIIDSAGNSSVVKIKVVVDPDKDKPRVTISSPVNNSIVGGEVPVNGNAKDNELVYDVLIKVIAQTDTEILSGAEGTDNVTTRLNTGKEIENGFVRIKTGGGDSNVPFDITLNAVDASGIITTGLTPPTGASNPNNLSRKVKVEIKARDANPDNATVPKTHTGTLYPAFLELNFSAVLPTIDQITIIPIGDSASPNTVNSTTAGTLYSDNNNSVSRRLVLRARITDDEEVGSISYRQEDEVNYTVVTDTSYQNNFKPWIQRVSSGFPTGANDMYWLYIPLNTNAAGSNGLVNGKYQNKADRYKLEIQVKDKTLPIVFTNQSTINLQIDNYFPVAYFNGNTKAAKAIHETYSIQGRAWDLAEGINVGGLERVVVYFTRNNALLPLIRGQTATNVTTQRAASAPKGAVYPPVGTPSLVPGAQMAESTLSFFPNVKDSTGVFTTTNSGIVINSNGTVGGYTQTFSGASTLIDWSVQFDSTNIDDGRAVLNYVVFDKLENASHYTEEVLIANYRPVITGINLGTDLNGDGFSSNTANFTERRDYSVIGNDTRTFANGYAIKSGFRVINNRLHFRMTFTGGNTSRYYRISHATRSASPVSVVASTIVKGNVYTIVEPGSIPWINYGAFVSASDYTGTTFVATDSYSGTPPAGATVYTYSGTSVSTDSVTSNITDAAITSFTNIPDGERLFLVKIYDRTYGTSTNGGDEIEQLADVVPILINIENTDTKAPTLDVLAFGKEWVLPSEKSGADTDNLTEVDVSNYNRNIVLECPNNASHDVFLSDTACPDCDHNLVTSPPTKRKGYVQYAATADISGKVVFTGKAADNQRIAKITAAISNFASGGNAGAEFTVAEWNPTSNTLAASTGTGWRFKIIDPHLTIDYGHAINWEFSWDSSLVTGTAASNVNVTFRVYDKGPNAATGIAKQRAVNVVPYITNIVTPLSDAYKANPSAFNRSALGWYPVREGQQITINGFNLANGTTANVTINEPSTFTASSVNKNSITGTVLAAAVSGPLTVTVSGITSFNNRNNNAAGRVNGVVGTGYNDEPNNSNNNILTDDRNIYVWSAGSLLNKSSGGNSTTLEYPAFRVSQTGKRLLVYNNQASGTGTGGQGSASSSFGSVVLMNNRASVNPPATTDYTNNIENTLNRYVYLSVAVDTGTNDTHWYVGANSQTSTGRTAYNLHSRNATAYRFGGTPPANITGTAINTWIDAASQAGNMQPGQYKTRILGNRVVDTDGSDSSRIRIPRIHSRSTGTDDSMIVMSYGDSLRDQNIYLHYGPATGTGASPIFGGDFAPAAAGNNTNGSPSNSTSATSEARGWEHAVDWTTTPSSLTFAQARQYAARIQKVTDSYSGSAADKQHRGSIYTASASIARSGSSIPVIAWYDRSAQNLLISYGNASYTSVTATSDWQNRATVVQQGVGTHVDMAVDGGNNVHLAYYDVLNGGLYYAYIPNSGFPVRTGSGGSKDVTGIRTVKVDTFLSAGTKIMINIREQGTGNYVPYITYLHSSFAETLNSVRAAWPVTASTGVVKGHNTANDVLAGTDANDRFLGNWEVMTVPVENVPSVDYFIANGVPRTSTGWVTPSGTDALNAGTYTNNDTSAHINRTILVGYMTDNRYEGAVLKKDLWVP